jgi:hypothetical protein
MRVYKRRTSSNIKDLNDGIKAEFKSLAFFKNKHSNSDRFIVYGINELREKFNLFDFLIYDKKRNKLIGIESESKSDYLYENLIKGFENKPKGYEDLSVSNKLFLNYDKLKFTIPGITEVVDRVVDEAYVILIDKDNPIKNYFLIDITKSIIPFYIDDFHTSRTKYRYTRRGKDYLIHIPFEEVRFYDYTN